MGKRGRGVGEREPPTPQPELGIKFHDCTKDHIDLPVEDDAEAKGS